MALLSAKTLSWNLHSSPMSSRTFQSELPWFVVTRDNCEGKRENCAILQRKLQNWKSKIYLSSLQVNETSRVLQHRNRYRWRSQWCEKMLLRLSQALSSPTSAMIFLVFYSQWFPITSAAYNFPRNLISIKRFSLCDICLMIVRFLSVEFLIFWCCRIIN